MPSISGSDLAGRIASGTAPPILDVRSGWEFRSGHVPGAVHLPFWTLPYRLRSLPLSRDEPVVVYCGHGPRAWLAGSMLRWSGFRSVLYLNGHMARWRAARLPLSRE